VSQKTIFIVHGFNQTSLEIVITIKAAKTISEGTQTIKSALL